MAIATMLMSTSSQPPNIQSEIERAVSRETLLFAAFMVVTIIGAFLTFALWRSGNEVQDLIRKDADARIGEAARDAELAKAEAAKANERAAELAKQAETERLARVRIEERLAARRVSESDRAASLKLLKPFAGATIVVSRVGDMEASAMADDVIKLFKEAQWNVQVQTFGTVSPPKYGLLVATAEGLPAGEAAAKVLLALPTAKKQSPLPASGGVAATVFVGLKPPA